MVVLSEPDKLQRLGHFLSKLKKDICGAEFLQIRADTQLLMGRGDGSRGPR